MKHDLEQYDHERLLTLADLHFHAATSDDESRELEAMLTTNSAARRAFLKCAIVHGQMPLTSPALESRPVLRLPFREAVTRPSDTPPAANRGREVNASMGIATMLLSVAVLMLLAVWLWPLGSPSTIEGPVTPSPVAGGNDSNASPTRQTAAYDTREPPIDMVATLGPNESGPTTLTIDRGESRFASTGGADVRLEGPTTFGVNTSGGGVLYTGSVSARLSKPNASYSVQTSNLRFVDLGTEFRVSLVDHENVSVHVLDGEVDVQSRVRLPIYFWTFDNLDKSSRSANDLVSQTHATIGSHAKHVDGLIGNGALYCDNTSDAYAKIEGGTGAKVGTGALACSSGITIEAMIVSKWSARELDYDEIFRKEDGIYRMLLGFQYDDNVGEYALPEVERGPCLSFGLHLQGLGYSELDMPLDGLQGRPTLAELTDGKPHHVVATYDSYTGEKAIYLDGQLRFRHLFPAGTMALSGGPTRAEIGNYFRSEPFHGTIDEVAFYDFALSADEIVAHHENVTNGISYFGAAAGQLSSARWQSVTQVSKGDKRLFNRNSGLPIDAEVVP